MSAEAQFFAGPEAEPIACSRCGTFAPLSSVAGAMLCAECAARMHEIARTPSSLGYLLKGIVQLLGRIGAVAAVIAFVFDLPISIAHFFFPVPFAVESAWGFVTLIGNAAILVLAQQVIAGRPTSVGEAFKLAISRYGSLLGASIVSGIMTFLFLLLLIVPGVVRALGYALILPLVLHENADTSVALHQSLVRMKGHRAEAFFAYMVLFIPGFFTVAAVAFAGGLVVAIDPTLEPQALFAQNAAGALFPILWLPVVLLPAVLYPKLVPQDEAAEL